MKFAFENNIAFLLMLVFAFLALASAMLVYFKNKGNNEFSKTQKWLLFILRSIGFFLCLLLFLKPIFISKKQIKEKPIIILASDNSQSVAPFADSIKYSLLEIKKELTNKYKLANWSFGENTSQNDSLTFIEKESDYSDLLATISSQYINQNIGALIVLGDGIYNSGQNPLNYVSKINFPVYTVGFGDTLINPDIRINNVIHNKSVFLNNYFTIEADINFEKLNNQIARIEIFEDDNLIDSRTITITDNNYFVAEKFRIQANHKGLLNYKIKAVPAGLEKNIENNTREFVIEVTDTKHQVLIVSDGPHPDIGAMKTILENYSNFDVSSIYGNSIPADINNFDLLILYQVPSVQSFNNSFFQQLANSTKPVLFIIGENTSFPHLNNLRMGISSPNSKAKGLSESQFSYNKSFTLFKIEDDYLETLESFPPLYVPYTEFNISKDLQILGTQKIKGITTSQPLIGIGNFNGRKTAYILGEGIWKWRIFNYSMHHQYGAINDFIYKIFNYLIVKENNNNFKIHYSTNYSENEEVEIEAELYNDSYELINTPDVSMVLKKDSLSEYRFIFDKIENKYILRLGKQEAGNYHINATVNLGDKEYQETGNFKVIRQNLENQRTVADHQFLYQLAYESGGKFFLPGNISKLTDKIQTNNEIKSDKFVHYLQKELLNSKWLFVLLVVLFGLEWFLRKYWGAY